jgi:preprotein translocase subunit SecY
MFRRILLVFTDAELRLKLFQIIGLLIAARLLAHVPIPVLKVSDISPLIENDQVFALLNTISGGSYGRLSFVMLGVGPYITASIVIQLLGVIIPSIREIQREEGEMGQQKINRWTRFLTVPLAALNSWGILQFLSVGTAQTGVAIELPAVLKKSQIDGESFWYWFAVIAAMTAGSIIMMWIGEIITEFKMGNGISLLILSGIVVRLPQQFSKFFGGVFENIKLISEKFEFSKLFNPEVWKALLWDNPTWQPARIGFLYVFIFLLTLGLVTFINDAVRKLIVIYSRRGHNEGKSRTLNNIKADLPIKVNMAGVLPIIFAVSFILFPTILSRFFFTANISNVKETAQKIESYLSTNQNQQAFAPGPVPKEILGFYGTKSASDTRNIQQYDSTVGQEILGFTVSTLKVDKNFEVSKDSAVSSPEELEKIARKEIKNEFFRGTPLQFSFSSGNLGFLPEFVFYWPGVLAYTFFYFFLIIFFTYFYTSTVAFKTEEVADNLQKSGAYVPGYRPGEQTANYLNYISNRLNVAGSLFLALIAILPLSFNKFLSFGDGTLTGIVGGTTLLILVSVTIETLKQIEAQATAVDYQRFTKY